MNLWIRFVPLGKTAHTAYVFNNSSPGYPQALSTSGDKIWALCDGGVEALSNGRYIAAQVVVDLY